MIVRVFHRLARVWRNLLARRRVEEELDEEVRAAFELLVDEKIRAGMRGQDARRVALMELGGAEYVKEAVRDARAGAQLEGWLRDLRYGIRTMARDPGFATAAVLTLALGIGVNSAVFSVVNGLLLQPLPWPNAERLVWIVSPVLSNENLGEWRAGMRSLERFSAFSLRSAVLTGAGPAERLDGMAVTEDFLPLLGAVPVRGRLWTADELRRGHTGSVVISHRLWARLGSPSDLSDLHFTLDRENFHAIGVLPEGFKDLHYDSDVWYPAAGEADLRFNIIALHRDEVSLADVQREANAVAARMSLAGAAASERYARAHTVVQFYTSDVRTQLLILLSAAGLVLLIACANVGNLLLARAGARERELSLRSALGASRRTLLRQLTLESAVLAICGAVTGWLMAVAGLRMVLRIMPANYAFGRAQDIQMNNQVLAFTFLMALAATMLAGLAPAVRASKLAATAVTASARVTASRGVQRLRETLMVSEIALALILLIGTGLLLRTFLALRIDAPGFDVRDRMIVSLRLPAAPPRDDPSIAEFGRRLLQDVGNAAPAARVAIATDVPLSGSLMNFPVAEIDGRPLSASESERTDLDLVSATPNYFDVMGMSLVRGRGLAASDMPGAPLVMVVNESAATRFWRDIDPIGHRVLVKMRNRSLEFTVVGVTRNTRTSGRNTNSRATAFTAWWQVPWPGFELIIHQPREAVLTGEGVRQIVAGIDPDVPTGAINMLEQFAFNSVAEPRYQMVVMTVFGGLALALALIGCYGVLSYAVAQRTREIGVRVALGASRATIVRVVLLRGSLLVSIGLLTGTAIALALTRVLESSLYGVKPTDPATFAASALALACVSLAAAYVPARRAAAIPPDRALRAE